MHLIIISASSSNDRVKMAARNGDFVLRSRESTAYLAKGLHLGLASGISNVFSLK